jgi:hypothetical protein
MAWHGAVLWGSLDFGKAGVVWRGNGRLGGAWWVEVRQVCLRPLRSGWVGRGLVRQVWLA